MHSDAFVAHTHVGSWREITMNFHIFLIDASSKEMTLGYFLSGEFLPKMGDLKWEVKSNFFLIDHTVWNFKNPVHSTCPVFLEDASLWRQIEGGGWGKIVRTS